jgi:hypothetical protein
MSTISWVSTARLEAGGDDWELVSIHTDGVSLKNLHDGNMPCALRVEAGKKYNVTITVEEVTDE